MKRSDLTVGDIYVVSKHNRRENWSDPAVLLSTATYGDPATSSWPRPGNPQDFISDPPQHYGGDTGVPVAMLPFSNQPGIDAALPYTEAMSALVSKVTETGLTAQDIALRHGEQIVKGIRVVVKVVPAAHVRVSWADKQVQDAEQRALFAAHAAEREEQLKQQDAVRAQLATDLVPLLDALGARYELTNTAGFGTPGVLFNGADLLEALRRIPGLTGTPNA